jgi:uncharacterized protein (DUF2461 family)
MTLVIQLPIDLEQRLREAAASAGLDPGEYVVAAVRDRLAGQESPAVASPEAELLQRINQGLPTEAWAEYRSLVERRRDETLTADEHERLIRLSDQIETTNARRIESLVELAGLRGTTVRALMDQLGIKQPPYE